MHIYQNPYRLRLSLAKRLASFWVTMGGCGMSPIGPGTAGSLLGVGLFWLSRDLLVTVQIGIIVLGFLLSLWAISFLQKKNKDVQDASWIVIDEGVGVWIALLGWDGTIQMLVACFVLFRLFDIFKPFPISYFDQKGHSGFLVMMDDVAAGLLTWSILYCVNALRVFV